MTGHTCGAHIATTIERNRDGRAPLFCRRWVPSFARACGDCGSVRDLYDPIDVLARFMSGKGERGGDVAKTVRRMREASEGFRAHKRRERVGA